MVDYELIGCRIKEARKKQKMTQEQLSTKTGIGIEYLSRMETGKVKPSLEYLDKICMILEVDLGKLVGGTSVKRKTYENDKLIKEFNDCTPQMREAILKIVKDLKTVK